MAFDQVKPARRVTVKTTKKSKTPVKLSAQKMLTTKSLSKKPLNKIVIKYWAYGEQRKSYFRRTSTTVKIVLGGKHVNTIVLNRKWSKFPEQETILEPKIKTEPED